MRNKISILISVFCLLFFVSTGNTTSLYSITELEFNYHSWGNSISINDSGQIAGMAKTPDNKEHAFLFDDGQMIDLGTLATFNGFRDSYASDINNLGQVVGVTNVDYKPRHAFLYENGVMTDLAFSIAGDGGTLQINDLGQMAINYYDYDNNTVKGVLYENGTLSDITIAAFSGGDIITTSINNSGQIVGYSKTSEGDLRGFIHQNGTTTDLNLSANNNIALSINNYGQIVGYEISADHRRGNAIMYDNGIVKDIGSLGGNVNVARKINDSGQIIGNSQNLMGENRGFIYEKGIMQDLNGLTLTNSNWEIDSANDINNVGQIVGYGLLDGERKSFLLDPIADIPEEANKLEAPIFGTPQGIPEDHIFRNLEYLSPFNGDRETVVIIHGWNREAGRTELPDWVDEMATAFVGKDVNVVAWNWQQVADAFLPLPGDPQDAVPNEALILSERLTTVLNANNSGSLHLIGHSLGAGIATRTAINLQEDFDINRLTLLDAPTGSIPQIGGANTYLGLLLPQINEENIFIENYVSEFGAYYTGDNVKNYGFVGGSFNDSGEGDHSWVHDWYKETVESSHINAGYNVPKDAINFDTIEHQVGKYEFTDNVIANDFPTQPSYSNGILYITDQLGLTHGAFGNVWDVGNYFLGISSSPVYFTTEFTAPEEDSFLSFELNMFELHEGDRFELWLNDYLLYSVYAELFNLNQWYNISDIDLSRWAGETVRLSLGLITEIDGVHSQFGIRNIEVYQYLEDGISQIPEPSTFILFIIGLLGFTKVHRKKEL